MNHKSLIKKLVKMNHLNLARAIYSLIFHDPIDFTVGRIQYLIYTEYQKTCNISLYYLNHEIEKDGILLTEKELNKLNIAKER